MRFYTQQCVDAYLAAMSTNPLHAMWSSAAPSWGEHADFVDERGAVDIRLKPAAAIVRQYGEQFRRPVRRKQNRRPKPPPLL